MKMVQYSLVQVLLLFVLVVIVVPFSKAFTFPVSKHDVTTRIISVRHWQQQQQQCNQLYNRHVSLSLTSSLLRERNQYNKQHKIDSNLCCRGDVKLSVAAAPPSSSSTSPSSDPTVPFWKVLWEFTRPHTLIGSGLAVPALSLLATPVPTWATTLGSSIWVTTVLFATIPALLMNLYITGLNQITDIEIDKINKPYLPLAAGTLSKSKAKKIVLLALFLSLWMGSGFIGLGITDFRPYATTGLNIALWGSGILGTLYSLEPFRFKRFPIMAAFCIVAVRGMIINASFYTHMKAVLTTSSSVMGSASVISGLTNVFTILWNDKLCWYSSTFFAFFGLVIALMKDVPDVLGDRIANIRTFSVRIGQEKVFQFMTILLQLLFGYVGIQFLSFAYTASATGGGIGLVISRIITSLAASTAAMSVRREAKFVTPTDSEQVYSYYMHLWKLFYLSYIVLPFAR
jgi:homogentisate phytyltransferase / homogentisate geranylgeranyltransferase